MIKRRLLRVQKYFLDFKMYKIKKKLEKLIKIKKYN